MSNEAYWKSSSDKVTVLKAVVSPTGQVVGKNYDRKALRDGDLGLELRVDRAKGYQKTPEQRDAVHAVAEQMIAAFGSSLGIESEEPLFAPGTLVKRIGENGDVRVLLVKRERNGLLEAQDISVVGKLISVSVPLAKYELEEYYLEEYNEEKANWRGLDALILYCLGGKFSRITVELVHQVESHDVLRAIACKYGMASLPREVALERFATSDDQLLEVIEDLRDDYPQDVILELACARLMHEENLKLVTMGDKPGKHAQLIAVKRMSQQESLAHAAELTFHDEVRYAALERITDQELLLRLFGMFVEKAYWQHAKDVLEFLEDPVVAVKSFLQARYTEEHRKFDRDALKNQANDKHTYYPENLVVQMLVEKLEDQDLLKRLYTYNPFMAEEAFFKIADMDWFLDQYELTDGFCNGFDQPWGTEERWKALLVRISSMSQEQFERLIDDPRRLWKFVQVHPPREYIAQSCLLRMLHAKMTDEQYLEYLLKLVRTEGISLFWPDMIRGWQLSESACHRLALVEGEEEAFYILQRYAVMEISFAEFLEDLAVRAPHPEIREFAQRRLDNHDTAQVVESDKTPK